MYYSTCTACDYIYQSKYSKCTYMHMCLFHSKLSNIQHRGGQLKRCRISITSRSDKNCHCGQTLKIQYKRQNRDHAFFMKYGSMKNSFLAIIQPGSCFCWAIHPMSYQNEILHFLKSFIIFLVDQ